jgi:hypothetical protein
MFTIPITVATATGIILFSIDSKVCTARGGGQLTVCPPYQKLTLTVFSHCMQQRDSSEQTRIGTTKK